MITIERIGRARKARAKLLASASDTCTITSRDRCTFDVKAPDGANIQVTLSRFMLEKGLACINQYDIAIPRAAE